MILWIQEAVLLAVRIKVGPGRRKLGQLAFGFMMNVERVVTGRQILQVEDYFDSTA